MADSSSSSIYSDHIIVAEDEFILEKGAPRFLYKTTWEKGDDGYLRCSECLTSNGECLAELLFTGNGMQISRRERGKFTKGTSYSDFAYTNQPYPPLVIRILEKKEAIITEFNNNWEADVNFVVNGQLVPGDRKYLAAISPVFSKMLYGEFAEASQDVIELHDVESAQILMDFFFAVSRLRIPPNPENVVQLTSLAHRFDVPFLLRDCEKHLRFCYEIPVIQRLLIADKYDMDELRAYICQRLSKESWEDLIADERESMTKLGAHFFMTLLSKTLT